MPLDTGHFEATLPMAFGYDYLTYLPETYESEPDKRWPLVLFLHGAGERGNDIEKVKVHGIPKLAEAGRGFPFIAVAPQCPISKYWGVESPGLKGLLDKVMDEYRVDADRVYVTGLSMGGYGTFGLAMDHPEMFAAIAPICGGGDPERAGLIKDIPAWVFHGAKDDVVPLEESQRMVDALKALGAEVRFTVYPEANHDSWTVTYENPELYEWLLSKTRKVK